MNNILNTDAATPTQIKGFEFLLKLFAPNSSGHLKLDLDLARKPVQDEKSGATTVLESLFCTLPMDEAALMFKLLLSHETLFKD